MPIKVLPLLVCLVAFLPPQGMAAGLFAPSYTSRITVRYSLPNEKEGKTVPSPKQVVYPTFPAMIVECGICGDVTIEIDVAPDGNVTSIRVVNATMTEFADVAVEAIKQWRYNPPFLRGKKIETSLKIICAFKFEAGWDLEEPMQGRTEPSR